MPTELTVRTRPSAVRRSGARDGAGGFGGDGARQPGPTPAAPAHVVMTGLACALAGITMLFVAFTTTYLGHVQAGEWRPIPRPWVLWPDTVILLASSAAVEWGRRRLKVGDLLGLRRGLSAGAALGVVFLAGQLLAWRQLAQQGVYLSSHPHSSFFYLLTGAHGAHLLGGLVAFAVILPRAWRGAYAPPAANAVTATSIYWHFLTALWVYVFAILFWA
jgi:cytochrome c oxidase subunit III